MDAPQPTPVVTKKDPLTDGTYIRTFAKDVAKLTGKPIQEGKLVVPKKDLSPPKPQKTLEEELTPDVGNMDAAAFAATRAGGDPKTQAVDAAREEILSRLKSKAQIDVTMMPKVEAPPPPKPEAPVAPLPPLVKKGTEAPSPLHTFKTDFAEKAGKEHASKIAVLAAEGDAKRTKLKPIKGTSTVSLVAIAVGAILIIGGGVGIFFAFKFANTAPVVPADTTPPSLIFADAKKQVSGTGADLLQALNSATSEALPDKSVLVTYITAASTSTVPLPGGALIAALKLPAPDILLRNVDESSTVGIVRAGREERPFFIFHVASYESTFAGMLTWEGTVARDLRAIYPQYQAEPLSAPAAASTTAATSSAPQGTTIVIPPAAAPTAFVDEVVANHDVRVLYDSQHRSLILYGYRDKQTLVIARDQAAFAVLLGRLSSTNAQ